MTWQDLDRLNIEYVKDLYSRYLSEWLSSNYSHMPPMDFTSYIEDLQQCEQCGEWEEELNDTEGLVNGGYGMICDSCWEDRG